MRRVLAGALALVAGTQAAHAADWTRAVAPNGAFSAETPCTSAELTAFSAAPNALVPRVTIKPESRLLCMNGGALMLAGVVEETGLPGDGKPLFDLIADMVTGSEGAEGDPKLGTISGRRSLYNRQEKDGVVALTGFVELSPTQIVMVIVGKEPGKTMSVADQDAVITRFSQSIEVSGK